MRDQKLAIPSKKEGLHQTNNRVSEFHEILKNSKNISVFQENILYQYYAEVGKYPLLTAEEESQYGIAAQAGDVRAHQKLLKGNLRLVIMLAQRYKNQGVELHDLISEGNLGVMHAIGKFKPEKGYRFSTYAVWWIRHYFSNAIMNSGRTVRVPIHINKAIARMLSCMKELSQKLNREATISEIAEETNQSIYEVMDLLAHHESMLSLDATISGNDSSGNDFHHIIPDENSFDTEKELVESETFSILEDALAALEVQTRRVIEYRFGINGRTVKTLEKTGELLGLTRDQVRYAQMKGIESLRVSFDEQGVLWEDILDW
ncbi:sigma-70 family RNA polymerase sigma factor [Ignatzschineria sp. LJL83]